jgi:type II secretory ATPase GspE/PulE/Tfp pilus assembly ATPase PilB-like protein
MHTGGFRLPASASREFLLENRVCPLSVNEEGEVIIAVGPTGTDDAVGDLAFAFGAPARVQPSTDDELDRQIERLTASASRSVELSRVDDDSLATDVRDLASQPPVVRYVNLLVRDAYDLKASDIHLESARGDLATRLRIDGALVQVAPPPPQLQAAVVSRLKLLAELDIAERRRPQDGRVRVRLEDRELDLRLSTIPTVHGESVVLRLLDHGGRAHDLASLGLPDDLRQGVERLVAKPHGMIIVTGPTGSGKTSTLYAALQRRDTDHEKVITVEDPVEYQLPGITQVPVHRASGVSFAGALRAILRQDPDVVMVGEMRDSETAEVAIQAALTGHLVLTTLHTNDALSAVPRLRDLGIPSYLIAATVEGVLAQRLVRRVCRACRAPYVPAPEHLRAFGEGSGLRSATLVRGVGCDSCRHTGYSGRTGLFELLRVTEGLRAAISEGAALAVLREEARAAQLGSLKERGRELIGMGETTVEEVYRAIQA